MLDKKSESFKKKLIFFLVGVITLGVFIFWVVTYDFQAQSDGDLLEDKLDLKQTLEQEEFLQERLENLEEAKEHFLGSQEGEGKSEIIEDKEVGLVQEKKGLVVLLMDIVFKDQETWIYLGFNNKNQLRVLIRPSTQGQIKIIQGDKEFPEVYTQRLIDYPLPDIIEAGEELVGALHFPALEPEEPLVLFIGGVKVEGEQEHVNFLFKVPES